jgi:hypothetical protein
MIKDQLMMMLENLLGLKKNLKYFIINLLIKLLRI